MGWMIRVEHTSRYRYRSVVRSSYNEARMSTLTTAGQVTLESHLSVEPRCRPFRYVDYWATVVDAFDIHGPHTELTVDATSVVETAAAAPLTSDIDWDGLGEGAAGQWAELLATTTYVPEDDGVVEVAAELRGGRSPVEAVQAASDWVSETLTYVKGVTRVTTSATEVFANRAGVCQDYAHLTLAVLRSMGVPARYVSGYLHPDADATPGDAVTGESHAWVEAWLGEWVGLDPTSATPAGERHVVVAYGRDYADVPPLKGVYLGGPAEDLEVGVVVTRLA